jgi:hypothetical protein
LQKSNNVAIVFCVHHKPWLMMATLVTVLAQDDQDADLFFVYNVGSGEALHADAAVTNGQLSPFDERVREVCRIRRRRVFEIEYQNDEALDSGAWYKFIRDGHWKPYNSVLFVGEGTLFARPTTLSGMLAFRHERGVHVIASGHEKRRHSKQLVLNYNRREAAFPSEAACYHDRMIAEAFAIFARDPGFRRLFEAWSDAVSTETQYHVPSVGPASPWLRRVRSAWARRLGPPSEGGWLRQLPWSIEYPVARARLLWPGNGWHGRREEVYVNGERRPVDTLAAVTRVRGVGFHPVDDPEWFGCATNHLMSHTFLERFKARLDQSLMWDVLNLRFAATPLEIIWGFIPAWLGFEKWFTDGFHRVRKDFVTYRREDYPPEIATYINRYYRGQLAVTWRGDYLKVRAHGRHLARLRQHLPDVYF